MIGSIRREITKEWRDLETDRRDEKLKGKRFTTGNIVDFCKTWLKFTPTAYQERFFLDPAKFLVARWARQTGKTTAISALVFTWRWQRDRKRSSFLHRVGGKARECFQEFRDLFRRIFAEF